MVKLVLVTLNKDVIVKPVFSKQEEIILLQEDFEDPNLTKQRFRPSGSWDTDYKFISDPADSSNTVLKITGSNKPIFVGDFSWKNYMFDLDFMLWDPERENDSNPRMSGMFSAVGFCQPNDLNCREDDSLRQSMKLVLNPRDAMPVALWKSWGEVDPSLGSYMYIWNTANWIHFPYDPVYVYFAGPSHLDRWYHLRLIPINCLFQLLLKKGKGKENLFEWWQKKDLEQNVWQWKNKGGIGFAQWQKDSSDAGLLIDNLEVTTLSIPSIYNIPISFNLPVLLNDDFTDPIKTFGLGTTQYYCPEQIFILNNELHLRSHPTLDVPYGTSQAELDYMYLSPNSRNIRITVVERVLDHCATVSFTVDPETTKKIVLFENNIEFGTWGMDQAFIHWQKDVSASLNNNHILTIDSLDVGLGSQRRRKNRVIVKLNGNLIWDDIIDNTWSKGGVMLSTHPIIMSIGEGPTRKENKGGHCVFDSIKVEKL